VNALRTNFALLMSGDEERHEQRMRELRTYLITEAQYDRRKVIWMKKDDLTLTSIKETMASMRKPRGEPALLIYYGHGDKGMICPTERSISYAQLAQAIGDKVFFINNTCYAGSAISAFREQGLLPRKAGILASTNEHTVSYSRNFFPDLLFHARQHLYFQKQTIAGEYLRGDIVYLLPSVHNFRRCVEKHYKQPKPYRDIQYPQRAGLRLDHLLFPPEKLDLRPRPLLCDGVERIALKDYLQ
jgi:hypothetical protein